MEFLAAALLGLILLGICSVAIVEGAYLSARIYSRLSRWLRWEFLLWDSGRQVRALKRRYGPAKEKSPRLGALRFTRSRAEEFGTGPPDQHGR
jgi:hypothetical protein